MEEGNMKAKILLVLTVLLVLALPGSAQERESDLVPVAALTEGEVEALIASGSASCSFVHNGGFEEGAHLWWFQSGSAQIWQLIGAWNGAWLAWQCGYDSCFDRLWQNIDMTGYGEAIPFFYYKMETSEGNRPWDLFEGTINDLGGGRLHTFYVMSNLSHTGGEWRWFSYLLPAELNDTSFQLSFRGSTDATGPTSLFLDDVIICAKSLTKVHLPVVLDAVVP